MTEDRIQEIYDNGAELTTQELSEYLEATYKSNIDENFTISDVARKYWIDGAEKLPQYIIRQTAESFDWRLEYKGDGKWYLHPWGENAKNNS